MARLTEQVKHFIVMELAVHRTPSEVVERVGEEFGLEITRQQVFEYDPTKSRGPELAKKWHELYHSTQDAFDGSTKGIPIAKKAYRLRELHEAALRAKKRGNDVLMAQLLEQAAKECGGSFTNHRQLSGPKGQPIDFRDVSHLTDEQIEARIKKLLGSTEAGDAA